MRALLLSLGMCLLPVGLLAQGGSAFPLRLQTTQPRVTVPWGGGLTRPCAAGDVRCAYSRGYRAPFYRSDERGSEYDRAWRSRGDFAGRAVGYGYTRQVGYHGPLPSCPTAVGGVTVVSPANPRYRPQPGRPSYRRYTIVPLASPIGCTS